VPRQKRRAKRGPLTAADEAEIWKRWRRGESVRRMVRGLGRAPQPIQRLIKEHGGVAPRPRRRSQRELTAQEREEVSRGLAAGESCRAISAQLGRASSSVSREVQRNGGREQYRAEAAEARAQHRRRRPKPCKLSRLPRLRDEVEARLKLEWSPQQISAWLKLEYPEQPEMQISHEAIYLSLYVQGRGVLRKELTNHLRKRRAVRQAKTQQATGRGHVPDRILISERPAEVADRAVPGHWEGDILLGKPTDGIGTLVERSTRYVLLFKLPGGRVNAESVREGMTDAILKLPASLRRSLTLDQGREMSQHARFSVDTGVAVYFCDPYHPWQRGTNENTNGLLRQYFPRGRSLARVTQAELDLVAERLNGRPRQTLGWKNPAQRLNELLEQSSSTVGGASTV